MFFGKGCTRSALDVQCIADKECFLRCLRLDIVYGNMRHSIVGATQRLTGLRA